MDKNEKQDPLLKQIFFSKYWTVKKLGEGSFGMIYKAESNKEEYALKFENRKKGQNLLQQEAYIMSYLKGPGIPFVKSYGYSGDYNILVMELLGMSLEDIFEALPRKKFSWKTVAMLGIQMLTIWEYIHEKHIIHRDIKPDNFVLGVNENKKYWYLLDFGLAKKYRSSKNLEHYPKTQNKKLTGTARYASISALQGFEQSRRDDLEAVGYVLVYFLLGSLPWQGLPIKGKEDRYQKIMEKKRDTKPGDLCDTLPKQFQAFIEYTRGLEYVQDPDYGMWSSLWKEVIKNEGCEMDYIYDWTTKEEIASSLHSKDLEEEKCKDENEKHQITIVNNYVNHYNNIVINKSEDNKIPNELGLNSHYIVNTVKNEEGKEEINNENDMPLKRDKKGNNNWVINELHNDNNNNNDNINNPNINYTESPPVIIQKKVKYNKCCIIY